MELLNGAPVFSSKKYFSPTYCFKGRYHDLISGNKARMELLNGAPVVKQEAGVEEPNRAGGGATSAAEDASRVEITVRLDVTLLHCPVCHLPLKPPVFTCDAAGHVACSSCHGKLPSNQCHARDCGGVRSRCPALHALVGSARIQCPYGQYGCQSYVVYCDVLDHQTACPHAPCYCTEPGCGFAAPPAALLGHLTAAHSWPVHRVHYGKVLGLGVPASEPRVLLVGDGDESVFLLAVGSLGPARAISVVRVGANAEAAVPRYTCKLWAHAPEDVASGNADFILMDSAVTSTRAPGEVAMEEVKFLAVPPAMIHGAEASKEMILSIRIDKTSPRSI